MWTDDDNELPDVETLDAPRSLTREELLAAYDTGGRRDGWRLDDMEDDR